MEKRNIQLIALFVAILSLCVGIIGIMAGITKPEIRNFLGLEDNRLSAKKLVTF